MGKVPFEPEQYKTIHGWFDYENLYKQVFEDLDDGAHIVEVGCWLGRSSCFMAELIKAGNKEIQMDCVDTWKGSHIEAHSAVVEGNMSSIVHDFVMNLSKANVLQYVNIIQANPMRAVNIYDDKSLDFVFLDDDHSETHVANELNTWWPKIKKGGILAGHDYTEENWPGVVKAVRAFSKAKRKKYSVEGNSFLFTK